MSSPEPSGDDTRPPRNRGSADVYVEHGHYFVMHADGIRPIGHYAEWEKGLMLYPAYDGSTGTGVYVRTGTFYGPVAVTVETFDTAGQAIPDTGRWDRSQEIEIVAGGPNLRVETDGGVEIELPQLHLMPGEAAGMRLYSRGVEEAAEIQEIRLRDGPVEFHLLQLWRA